MSTVSVSQDTEMRGREISWWVTRVGMMVRLKHPKWPMNECRAMVVKGVDPKKGIITVEDGADWWVGDGTRWTDKAQGVLAGDFHECPP